MTKTDTYEKNTLYGIGGHSVRHANERTVSQRLSRESHREKNARETTPKQAVEPADDSENTDYITEELQAIVNPEYDTEDSATPMTLVR